MRPAKYGTRVAREADKLPGAPEMSSSVVDPPSRSRVSFSGDEAHDAATGRIIEMRAMR